MMLLCRASSSSLFLTKNWFVSVILVVVLLSSLDCTRTCTTAFITTTTSSPKSKQQSQSSLIGGGTTTQFSNIIWGTKVVQDHYHQRRRHTRQWANADEEEEENSVETIGTATTTSLDNDDIDMEDAIIAAFNTNAADTLLSTEMIDQEDETEHEITTNTTTTSSSIPTELETLRKELYPDAILLEFVIEIHRPLGCTVEESLSTTSTSTSTSSTTSSKEEMVPDTSPPVFVSKVAPGGYANSAGIQIGDVIVGITGIFGTTKTVIGLGIEQVKSLVSAIPEDEPLTLIVARGTTVLADHESALVDLCTTNPGASDKAVEECVVAYLKDSYDLDKDDDNNPNMDKNGGILVDTCDNEDEEMECMIDAMTNMWADELPLPTTSTEGITDMAETPAQKVKPWSSRSSPSGTYVRDPKTGEMRNIDPQY